MPALQSLEDAYSHRTHCLFENTYPSKSVSHQICDSKNVKNCPYLRSLLPAIKSSMETDQEADLLEDINDFIHLLMNHDDDDSFSWIYDQLDLCKISKCLSHRRNTDKIESLTLNTNSDELPYYQVMDRIHCYYLHTFDIGYKIIRYEAHQILNNPQEIKSNDTS